MWIHAPDRALPEAPILWVLDAASLFPSVVAAMEWLTRRSDVNAVAPMLLAGIDHDPRDRDRRFCDFSFVPVDDPAGQISHVSWGGGPSFAELLCGTAREMAASAFGVETKSHALLGHSMGGLFALHLLAEKPDAFAVIGAMSPSIWWRREAIENVLRELTDYRQTVFLGAGGLEQPGRAMTEAEVRRCKREVLTNLEAIAATLTKILGPGRVRLKIADGETHASALLTLLPRFLRVASDGLRGCGSTP